LNITFGDHDSPMLSKCDLAQTLTFINQCLKCGNEPDFNRLILSFAAFLGFEFVLCCYTQSSYSKRNSIKMENLSNPEEWAEEYNRERYLLHDPVRHEVERRLDTGVKTSFIYWDAYEWELSPLEQMVIERRKHYGLTYGCSVFSDSERKDFTFLVSLASRTTTVDARVETIAKSVVSHLMVTRKRLGMLALVNALSDKEKETAKWIMSGKTNWEIAQILNVTENTVKFHIKNIFGKLRVTNRQQAIAILLAERYLSI
jgi:DNA-binding CsgD family transcriptional regulator